MKSILCYGDSNTWGFATRPDDEGRYAPAERWPGVLAARLGAGWTVVAEGLNGRTTVHADPIEGRCLDGSAYLLPCLKSHRPLDAVAIMLGTNDLKARFNISAAEIAWGAGQLLRIAVTSQTGPGGKAPKLLLVCPPPILDHHGDAADLAEMFIGGYRKSLAMAERYALVAKEHGAAFLNAGDHIKSSAFDGIHLDADAQAALGRAVGDHIVKLGW